MAFINFNKSTILNEAIKNSVTSQNTLYFPPDSATIVKNGKVYGISSCGTSLSFDASTGILSHTASGVTSGNYGPSSDVTGAFSGSFTVPYITVNTFGHITSASNKKITIPAIAHSHATYTNVTAHAHAHSHSGYLTNVTSHTHSHSHNYADTAGSAETAYFAEWSDIAHNAEQWKKSSTLKIGNKTNNVNANSAITFTLADIGAASTSHSHGSYATTSYLTSLYQMVNEIYSYLGF